jgi:hypothetical protein
MSSQYKSITPKRTNRQSVPHPECAGCKVLSIIHAVEGRFLFDPLQQIEELEAATTWFASACPKPLLTRPEADPVGFGLPDIVRPGPKRLLGCGRHYTTIGGWQTNPAQIGVLLSVRPCCGCAFFDSRYNVVNALLISARR